MLAEARPRGERGRVESVLETSEITKITTHWPSHTSSYWAMSIRVTSYGSRSGENWVGCGQMGGNIDVLKNLTNHLWMASEPATWYLGYYWLKIDCPQSWSQGWDGTTQIFWRPPFPPSHQPSISSQFQPPISQGLGVSPSRVRVHQADARVDGNIVDGPERPQTITHWSEWWWPRNSSRRWDLVRSRQNLSQSDSS